MFLPLAATCSDGIGCTHSDACIGGKCLGTFGCDDGNPCTFDGCNAKIGDCVFLALDGTPCDDGTPCTVAEACKSGQCLALKVLSCDDANSCTSAACDKLKGCYHYDSPLPCSTGGCYADDSCVNATCKAGTQARLGAWPVAKQEPGSSAFDLHGGILQPDGGLLAWGASAGGYFGGFGAGPGWVVRTDKLGKVQWQAAQLPIGKHSMGYVVRCFQESAVVSA